MNSRVFGGWLAVAALLSGRVANAATFNVHDYGAKGDGVHDDAPGINRAIQAAEAAGPGNTVVVPAGRYRLTAAGETGARYHLILRAADHLTVRGVGAVTLVNTVLGDGAFGLYNSQICTVKNFTLTNADANFSQATVRAVDAAAKSIRLSIDPGYDELDRPGLSQPDQLKLFPVSGSPAWNQGLQPRILGKTKLGPGQWLLTLDTPLGPEWINKKAVYWPGGSGFSFDVIGCDTPTVSDIRDYPRLGNNGFAPRGCTGLITFRNYVLGPPPGSGDLLAAAGVSQGVDNRGTLLLDHCDWRGFDDDGVNQLAPFAHIVAKPGPYRLSVAYDVYQVGDTVSVWDWAYKHARERAQAKVVSVVKNGNGTETLTLDKDIAVGTVGPQVETDRSRIMRDGIDRLCDLSAVGSAIIRHCRLSCRRARPILIKSRNALIEDCTIYDSHSPGIQAGAEMYWDEGPQTLNLTVRGCTFENIDTAAIDVGLFADGSDTSLDCKHIVIENNVFRNNGQRTTARPWMKWGYGPQGIGIRLRNTDGAVIRNNVFINNPGPNIVVQYCRHVVITGNAFAKTHGGAINADPAEVSDKSAVILIDHATSVSLSGNTLTKPGPFFKHFIAVTPSCTDVTGQSLGYHKP